MSKQESDTLTGYSANTAVQDDLSAAKSCNDAPSPVQTQAAAAAPSAAAPSAAAAAASAAGPADIHEDAVLDTAAEVHGDGIHAAETGAGSMGAYGRAAKASEAQHIDEHGDYYKPWIASYPDAVPEFVDTHQFENLSEIIDRSVELYGDHPAFVNMGSQLTFNELGEFSEYFAAYLQLELNLKPGDKIAVMMPNLMQFPIVFFGAVKAGLVITNVNPLYTPRELKNQLDNSDATTIVVMANFTEHLVEILSDTKILNVIVTEVGDAFTDFMGAKRLLVNYVVKMKGMVPKVDFDECQNHASYHYALKRGQQLLKEGTEDGRKFVRAQPAYDDIVLLQYTGGTTGRSKGAMISHGNIIANIAQAYGMYGAVLTPGGETILTVIPLYHIFALTVNFLLFVYLGGKNILITDPRDIKGFAKELHNHPEITAMTGVNTLFNLFITHEEFKDLTWEHLHIVIGGGAAVQSGVEQRFFEKTGFHILEGYGLTECSPLCSVCPFDVDHYTGSIGLIVPSTIARIVDADGKEIRDLEHEGELEIKGPQVMHGYYKCDRHNDFIFDEGYVRTGDIAKWMEGGYIKLIDRLKDMILVSGFNVFPNEIEDVVSRFNRVLECAVIGVPSESTGEAVKLFVVKKDPDLTAEEVKQYCRAYLTPYKVPHKIEFVEALPKSSLGKVLRRKLRDLEQLKAATAVEQAAVSSVMAAAAVGAAATTAAPAGAGSAYAGSAGAVVAGEGSADAPDTAAGAAKAAAAGAGSLTDSAGNSNQPVRKSAGALALERLLSSKDDGLAAAVSTPNIHQVEQKSQLVRSAADSRYHVGSVEHDRELDE